MYGCWMLVGCVGVEGLSVYGCWMLVGCVGVECCGM